MSNKDPDPHILDTLYDQLDDFDFSERLKQLSDTNKVLHDKIQELKGEIVVVSDKCSNLEKENEALKTNISTLYKTAIAEVNRKDRLCIELRKQLEEKALKGKSFTNHKSQNPPNPIVPNIMKEEHFFPDSPDEEYRRKFIVVDQHLEKRRLNSQSPDRHRRSPHKRQRYEHEQKSNRSRSRSKSRNYYPNRNRSRSNEKRRDNKKYYDNRQSGSRDYPDKYQKQRFPIDHRNDPRTSEYYTYKSGSVLENVNKTYKRDRIQHFDTFNYNASNTDDTKEEKLDNKIDKVDIKMEKENFSSTKNSHLHDRNNKTHIEKQKIITDYEIKHKPDYEEKTEGKYKRKACRNEKENREHKSEVKENNINTENKINSHPKNNENKIDSTCLEKSSLKKNPQNFGKIDNTSSLEFIEIQNQSTDVPKIEMENNTNPKLDITDSNTIDNKIKMENFSSTKYVHIQDRNNETHIEKQTIITDYETKRKPDYVEKTEGKYKRKHCRNEIENKEHKSEIKESNINTENKHKPHPKNNENKIDSVCLEKSSSKKNPQNSKKIDNTPSSEFIETQNQSTDVPRVEMENNTNPKLDITDSKTLDNKIKMENFSSTKYFHLQDRNNETHIEKQTIITDYETKRKPDYVEKTEGKYKRKPCRNEKENREHKSEIKESNINTENKHKPHPKNNENKIDSVCLEKSSSKKNPQNSEKIDNTPSSEFIETQNQSADVPRVEMENNNNPKIDITYSKKIDEQIIPNIEKTTKIDVDDKTAGKNKNKKQKSEKRPKPEKTKSSSKCKHSLELKNEKANDPSPSPTDNTDDSSKNTFEKNSEECIWRGLPNVNDERPLTDVYASDDNIPNNVTEENPNNSTRSSNLSICTDDTQTKSLNSSKHTVVISTKVDANKIKFIVHRPRNTIVIDKT